jgi:hypothetical protein
MLQLVRTMKQEKSSREGEWRKDKSETRSIGRAGRLDLITPCLLNPVDTVECGHPALLFSYFEAAPEVFMPLGKLAKISESSFEARHRKALSPSL